MKPVYLMRHSKAHGLNRPRGTETNVLRDEIADEAEPHQSRDAEMSGVGLRLFDCGAQSDELLRISCKNKEERTWRPADVAPRPVPFAEGLALARRIHQLSIINRPEIRVRVVPGPARASVSASRPAAHAARTRRLKGSPVRAAIGPDARVDRDTGAGEDEGAAVSAAEEGGQLGRALGDREARVGVDVGRGGLDERGDRDPDHGRLGGRALARAKRAGRSERGGDVSDASACERERADDEGERRAVDSLDERVDRSG